MSSTVLTDDTGKQLIAAMNNVTAAMNDVTAASNAVTAELKNCLKNVNGTSISSMSSSATPEGGGGGASSTSSALSAGGLGGEKEGGVEGALGGGLGGGVEGALGGEEKAGEGGGKVGKLSARERIGNRIDIMRLAKQQEALSTPGGAGETQITVKLLMKLNDGKNKVVSCRIVNKEVKILPVGYIDKIWFNHQLTFKKDASGAITLNPSTQTNIDKNTVTFLNVLVSPTKNATEITISEIIINNIIKVLDAATGPTYEIPKVYLEFDNTVSGDVNPWSLVDAAPSTDEDKEKTIEITPDVQIVQNTNEHFYSLSFIDYARFNNNKSDIKFIDGKTKIVTDENAAKNIDARLKSIKSITMLGGGKKKRQSRKLQKYTKKLSKGGKKRRQSYRRF